MTGSDSIWDCLVYGPMGVMVGCEEDDDDGDGEDDDVVD